MKGDGIAGEEQRGHGGGQSLRDEVRGRIWGKVGGHKRPCMRV